MSFGATRVLCTASVEDGVPGWRRGRGEGWLTAEYAMLPRATQHAHVARARAARRAHAGDPAAHRPQRPRDARRLSRSASSRSSSTATCCMADGGTRTASITGACVAAVDAFDWLVQQRRIAASPVQAARRGGERRRDRSRRRGSISTTRKTCAPRWT